MMANPDARRARILGWLMMAASMILLLASIFGALGDSTGTIVPVAMMFLVFAILLFARSNPPKDDASKREGP